MVHQANKPLKISQVSNLFCSGQGPLYMKEASRYWSRLIHSAPRVMPCTVLCTAAWTWCTLRCSGTYRRHRYCSLHAHPVFTHLAVQRPWWGQHVTH